MMNDEFKDTLLASYPRSSRFAGEHVCPRVEENACAVFRLDGRAVWTADHCCSYCNSLNPDLFMEMVESGTATLGPTDKNYKVYVKAEGLTQTYRADGSAGGSDPSKWEWTTRSTTEGKFYFQHLSEPQKQRFVELLNGKKLKLDYPGYFYRLPFFVQQEPKKTE